ncbi:sulfatase [Planctomycetota bacterium]|nr:sulfatase [Planctomycetota bacterium]
MKYSALLGAGLVASSMVMPKVVASEVERPNILLIIADDWSDGHASYFGTKWLNTPNIDRVAREGVSFTNTFTSNPKSAPCRASLLTGRYSWQLEEGANHNGDFPGKFVVYPTLLEKSGYKIGLTQKGWGPGNWKTSGLSHNPAGPQFGKYKTTPPASGMSNNDYARNFQDFLDKTEDGKPWCFWMGITEPHRPYEADSGVKSGKKTSDVDLPEFYPDSDVIRKDILDYALEVEWFDEHIGRSLKLLEESGQLDNTVVIVTSDHGMPFPRIKGQVYEEGYSIPLFIRWGNKIKPGRVVDDFINVSDFAPTFLQLANLPIHKQMTGQSFLKQLLSSQSGQIDTERNFTLVGKERHDIGRPHDWGYPARAIRTEEFLYVKNYHPERWPVGNPETGYPNCDGGPTKQLITKMDKNSKYYQWSFGKRPQEELYNVVTDRDCVINLADDPNFEMAKKSLKQKLQNELIKQEDPRSLGNGKIFDTYLYSPKLRGFYEKWQEKQRKKKAKK